MGADYEQYPFPEGKHPSGWLETTVGEVLFEIRSGYSSGKHNKAGAGIPHLRPMNVSPVGEILMDDVRYVLPSAGSLRLAKDDVLFTNTSSTVWVGKTALVEKPSDWGFSNHMTRLRVADGMSPEFVARQLHYLCMSGYFAFHCKKHINQSSVGGKQLAEEVPFRLPPANEQKRIAAKLRRLLARERKLRQQLDELPELTKQYRAAVLEAACTGRLVPTEAELARKERRDFEPASVLLERILVERRAQWEGDQLAKMRAAGKEPKDNEWKENYVEPAPARKSSLPKLPRGWIWVSLGQLIVHLRNGIGIPPNEDNGLPALRISAVRPMFVDLTDRRYFPKSRAKQFEEFALNKGDLLFTRYNGSKDLAGVCGRVPALAETIVYPDKLIRCVPVPGFEPLGKFVEIAANTGVSRKIISENLRTTAGQWGLSGSVLREIPIPLPPSAEQKSIVAEVKRRLHAIAKIESQMKEASDRTGALRISFFHHAQQGKLVGQNKSDEPAKELLARIRIEREKRKQTPKRAESQRKAKMKKLSPEFVKEAIAQLSSNRFSFDELSAALQADYDPLKDIVFELLGEAKPGLRQVFDAKTKTMQFERIKP